ncbi:DEAD/DEAH box helicase [Clostridium algidicarnis]|uniref:DEAD/DEAH box helicase n=1 Tax=Clostridium algidicarnis TaxID=37659 RepID=UPI001C0CE599|nr:DEAD/DEAH box helicase [Clostridium algidicarnis]MBU3204670.1 DEAD/DEAH box helicase [Clostridium algidicarnis]MBU3212845.1 DEAD/DEAH box helicase [Clostridium algidicarnis]MBU3223489.1 DEAD/DEAH box helicase [Clostridium algidicarnis]
MENLKFNDLTLNKNVLKSIEGMGFEEPSKIQQEVIPIILEGFDVIGQAQTGTGKTLAFGAPIISNLNRSSNKIHGIILTPTRELAIQVSDELVRIGKDSNLKMLPVYGGQSIDRQIQAIRRNPDIIVGTPGRVLDLLRRKILDLKFIDFLVLDEADEMLNMGFVEDIELIIQSSNEERQTLLFSATMPNTIKKIAQRYMKKDTKHISIVKNQMTVSTVEQFYYEIKHNERFESLCRILDVEGPDSCLIFCKTKKGVDEVVESMQSRGYSVEGMHGDMNQNQRLNTLRKFKDDSIDFLVATDVAARGIDVTNITHVINYDLPQDTESYVHRIGRTGRANKKGIAYTLVSPREYKTLKQIESATKGKIKRKPIPTIDDIFSAKYASIIKKVKETLENKEYSKFVPIVTELDEEYDLIDVSAALMTMIYGKEISYNSNENNDIASNNNSSYSNSYSNNSNSYNNRRSNSNNGDVSRLFLSIGHLDKIKPKSLVDFLTDNSNADRNSIGNIDILDKFTFIDVKSDAVDSILNNCSGKSLEGRRVNIEIAKSSK